MVAGIWIRHGGLDQLTSLSGAPFVHELTLGSDFIDDPVAVVCGSRPFTDRVLTTLRALEVPKSQIHAQRSGA